MTTSRVVPGTTRDAVELNIDGRDVSVPKGSTILDACGGKGGDIPTLCYGDTITPKNACRVCMVEVEGSRVLVPSCSREVEDGMVVTTRSERVDHSRKMVLEFLGSSVDLSLTDGVDDWNTEYGADPTRYGSDAATVADQPVKIDNDLYVRDYAKCILCYQCVDACGEQWQNSFVIEIAGRGFDARVSTENDVPLPDSACVYCGNCIQVCPTGALMFKSEHDMREAGTWDEAAQTTTDTICAFCGVGCNLTLHVQDNTIVKVSSPPDSEITHGNLCVKGRFGFQHAQNLPD
ncbi:MAG: 2Fe-2S iron-sulfur cluster-binding protein [Ilumatobacteraceae bacterium]|nr:2Fe-2S iron-sulfur cluster-binding protein [Ilumatobacteraceae bacterium]